MHVNTHRLIGLNRYLALHNVVYAGNVSRYGMTATVVNRGKDDIFEVVWLDEEKNKYWRVAF